MKKPIFSSEPEKESFNGLRLKAEKALDLIEQGADALEESEINVLFQELQLHQIELEMQNDELQIANQELEMQQSKFAGIYNLAPVGYFILNSGGLIEEVNQAGLHLLGTGKAAISYKNLQSFTSAEHTDRFYRFYHDLLKTRQKRTCQLKMVSKSGHQFEAHVEGIAIDLPGSRNTNCYIAIIDVTERIAAETSLAETKESLELALQASAAGTWELDSDTMKFFLDESSHQRLCSLPDDKFEGTYQAFLNLVHPDDREAVDQHFRTAINQEFRIDIVCRINSKREMCYASIRGHMMERPGRLKHFVGIIMDISEKMRREKEADQMKQEQQKAITAAILATQENERKRISDTLHDSVSQLIYGIKIKLGSLPSNTTAKLIGVNELLNSAINEIRNLSFELAPAILNDFGLPATIEELANRLSTPKMQIRTTLTSFSERLGLQMELTVFRIIQELVNNCMKHADATEVYVGIRKGQMLDIRVKDNGKGFPVKKQETATTGSGLSSIKNRLMIYNGSMIINSKPGKGTEVQIFLDPRGGGEDN